MNDIRRAGILRDAIGGRRIRYRDILSDTLEVRRHVGGMPSRRRILIENFRRIGLEQHPVEHRVAAETDALPGEGSLRELKWRAGRLEGQQRVFAGHVENRKVSPVGRQPRRKVRTADSCAGGAASFNDQDALFAAARSLQLGSDDRTCGAAADNDRIETAGSLGNGASATAAASGESDQRRTQAQAETGLSGLEQELATTDYRFTQQG